jgi:hypothetical protein
LNQSKYWPPATKNCARNSPLRGSFFMLRSLIAPLCAARLCLVAWFGTSRQVQRVFHQYELDLREQRMVIAGLNRVLDANEAELRAQADELREARLLMRQMQLDLEAAR